MPILPFKRFAQRRPPGDSQTQVDRGVRQTQQAYTDRGYSPQFAEQQAGEDAQLAEALRKKRGLKGVKIGGAFNQ